MSVPERKHNSSIPIRGGFCQLQHKKDHVLLTRVEDTTTTVVTIMMNESKSIEVRGGQYIIHYPKGVAIDTKCLGAGTHTIDFNNMTPQAFDALCDIPKQELGMSVQIVREECSWMEMLDMRKPRLVPRIYDIATCKQKCAWVKVDESTPMSKPGAENKLASTQALDTTLPTDIVDTEPKPLFRAKPRKPSYSVLKRTKGIKESTHPMRTRSKRDVDVSC